MCDAALEDPGYDGGTVCAFFAYSRWLNAVLKGRGKGVEGAMG